MGVNSAPGGVFGAIIDARSVVKADDDWRLRGVTRKSVKSVRIAS